jgi:DNA phosphorothioation-dependent restriction protein DptH
MEILKTPNTYYKKIIDLILHLHKEDLSTAVAGHCMKITGLGLNELDFL